MSLPRAHTHPTTRPLTSLASPAPAHPHPHPPRARTALPTPTRSPHLRAIPRSALASPLREKEDPFCSAGWLPREAELEFGWLRQGQEGDEEGEGEGEGWGEQRLDGEDELGVDECVRRVLSNEDRMGVLRLSPTQRPPSPSPPSPTHPSPAPRPPRPATRTHTHTPTRTPTPAPTWTWTWAWTGTRPSTPRRRRTRGCTSALRRGRGRSAILTWSCSRARARGRARLRLRLRLRARRRRPPRPLLLRTPGTGTGGGGPDRPPRYLSRSLSRCSARERAGRRRSGARRGRGRRQTRRAPSWAACSSTTTPREGRGWGWRPRCGARGPCRPELAGRGRDGGSGRSSALPGPSGLTELDVGSGVPRPGRWTLDGGQHARRGIRLGSARLGSKKCSCTCTCPGRNRMIGIRMLRCCAHTGCSALAVLYCTSSTRSGTMNPILILILIASPRLLSPQRHIYACAHATSSQGCPLIAVPAPAAAPAAPAASPSL
ncbi:hypothetical protein CALCODRAFT_58641 [Calocera cornea HHB12733]|uniref:Uncharacterized protein n=1 Tax=Calocera cornea HHB12733 TaxID=1353952 RepID=A0A165IVW6_9BASI|nr:hypothetical protein CALCODRAFT_58641 [Calocera cornea HHB12733]